MNIIHSKGTMKLIRLNPIDQLMNKYEGQYTGNCIRLENKMLYELYDKICPGWRNNEKVETLMNVVLNKSKL